MTTAQTEAEARQLRVNPSGWQQQVQALAAENAQLRQALASRIVIEQAKGILAERLWLRPDEAFELIRHAARSNRVRIHDLAAQVVANRRTPRAIQRQIEARATAEKNGGPIAPLARSENVE